MLRRCDNPKNISYKNYGERGIKVCKRWRKFENFLADMGRKPERAMSVERINNAAHYTPKNCRWATRQEQMNNMRANRWLTIGGEVRTVADWARRLGINGQTIYQRLHRGQTAKQVAKHLTRLVAGRLL
jgi:hypothetical protein